MVASGLCATPTPSGVRRRLTASETFFTYGRALPARRLKRRELVLELKSRLEGCEYNPAIFERKVVRKNMLFQWNQPVILRTTAPTQSTQTSSWNQPLEATTQIRDNKANENEIYDQLESLLPKCFRISEDERTADLTPFLEGKKCLLENFDSPLLKQHGFLNSSDLQCYPTPLLNHFMDPNKSLVINSEGSDTFQSNVLNESYPVAEPMKSQPTDKAYKPLTLCENVAEIDKGLHKLMEPLNFMRNPRFPDAGKQKILSLGDLHAFAIEPKDFIFDSFEAGGTFEKKLTLRNVSKLTRALRIIPPKSEFFEIGEGHYPEAGDNTVAPGLSCSITIFFKPTLMRTYSDELEVQYESQLTPLIVTLRGHRKHEQINFPREWDLGTCLVGASKKQTKIIRNFGKWSKYLPKIVIKPVNSSSDLSLEIFRLTPASFELPVKGSVTMSLEFTPNTAGPFETTFEVHVDGEMLLTTITCRGEGERLALSISEENGEPDKELCLFRNSTTVEGNIVAVCRLPPQCPEFRSKRRFSISSNNTIDLELQWVSGARTDQCVDEEKERKLSDSNRTTSNTTLEFLLERTLLLAKTSVTGELIFESTEVGNALLMGVLTVRCVSTTPSVTFEQQKPLQAIYLEVSAETQPIDIRLEPESIIMPEPTFTFTSIQQSVRLINRSETCPIAFRWDTKKALAMVDPVPATEVDTGAELLNMSEGTPVEVCVREEEGTIPAAGEFVVNLTFSSHAVGYARCLLPCQLNGNPDQRVWLRLEAEFRSAPIQIDVPDIQFGIIRLFHSSTQKIQLSNPHSVVPLAWTAQFEPMPALAEGSGAFSLDLKEGHIGPGETMIVQVTFNPQKVQTFDALIKFSVSGASSKLLRVTGEARVPVLALDTTHVTLAPIYLGIPTEVIVKLTNKSVLPVSFQWTSTEGADASWVEVIATPSDCRCLPAFETVSIRIQCISRLQRRITDLRLLCKVDGQQDPLRLDISGDTKGLSFAVTSLPLENVLCKTTQVDPYDSNYLTVDDDAFLECSAQIVGPLVEFDSTGLCIPRERWIEVNNTSAIPALFTLQVDTFGCQTDDLAKWHNPPSGTVFGVQRLLQASLGANQKNETDPNYGSHVRDRLIYDWCKTLVPEGQGCAIVAHSFFQMSHLNENLDDRAFDAFLKSGQMVNTETFTLPAFSTLRICLLAVGDVFGAFYDQLQIVVQPASDLLAQIQQPIQPVQMYLPLRFRVHGSPVEFITALQCANQLRSTYSEGPRSTSSSSSPSSFKALFDVQGMTYSRLCAWETTVHLGCTSVLAEEVVRKVRMRNTSSFNVRIDWQLYRSRPDKEDSKLLDLCALFGEAFRPAQSRTPSSAAEGCGEERSPPRCEVGEFGPIRLILRPHEGQLVGKSPWAMTSEVPEAGGLSGLLTIEPWQLLVAPGAEAVLTVKLNGRAAAAAAVTGDVQVRAFALGYLTIEEDNAAGTRVLRPEAFISPHLRLTLTTGLQQPKLDLEFVDENGCQMNLDAGEMLTSDRKTNSASQEIQLPAFMHSFLVTETEIQSALASTKGVCSTRTSLADVGKTEIAFHPLEIARGPRSRLDTRHRSSTSSPVEGPHLAECLVCVRGLRITNRGSLALGVQANIQAPNFFLFEDGTQTGLPRLSDNRHVRLIMTDQSRWPRLNHPSCEFVLEPGCKKLIQFGFVFNRKDLTGLGREAGNQNVDAQESLFNKNYQRMWFGSLQLRVCNPNEMRCSREAVVLENASPVLHCSPLRISAVMKMPRLELLSPAVIQGRVTFVRQTSTLFVRLANHGPSREVWVLEEVSSVLYKPSLGSLNEPGLFPLACSSTSPSESSEPCASASDSDGTADLTQSRSVATVSSSQLMGSNLQAVADASEAFIFTTKSGFLEAAGDIKRKDITRLEVTFAPKEDGVFEKVVYFVGLLSGNRVPVTFTAEGSFDERFDQHFAE
nr:unnamed protein product [Spirometra erinaceieuropaei]